MLFSTRAAKVLPTAKPEPFKVLTKDFIQEYSLLYEENNNPFWFISSSPSMVAFPLAK